MNYIELGFWGITASALVLGIIMGAVRGANRSVLRLVLVLVCAVAAFFLKETVTSLILEIKVGDVTVHQTILNFLAENFGESFAEMGDTVVIMVSVLASVMIFLVMFYLLKILTWAIVYPLCKLFVKKGKKKHAVIGGVVGLVQGVVIALCVCVPLGGLVVQTEKLMVAASDLSEAVATAPSDGYYASADDGLQDPIIVEEASGDDGENSENGSNSKPAGDSSEEGGGFAIPEDVTKMMSGFGDSFIGKFYTKTLKTPFTWIASAKVEVTNTETGKKETKKYTLEGQIDAVVGAVRMMKDFSELKDIDWDNVDFDSDVATQIKGVMDNLQNTKGQLSDESIETINNVAGAMLGQMGLPVEVDASKFDLKEVDFAKEGNLIVDVVDRANKDDFTSEDLKAITKDLSESTLVMPMLESVSSPMNLPEDKKEKIEAAFADPDLNDYDQDVLNTLRNLFGLSNGGGNSPTEPAPEVSE
ncbi:MAG: hypothetical protein NC132_04315 [Corallococcus sp.]|nr:hypothetical protein [Corallococcus sp.]MCM1359884.1 hypothetical protein [Corallococcus sp.]MCM1395318.1 hypothetical protein [Corallococcus sp.]